MSILTLNRDTVIKQTIQNMVEARVVKPDETDVCTEELQRLDQEDLLVALLASHNFREQAKELIRFFPIDMDAISKN